MTRAATPDEIADHDRDLRKHEPRPDFDQIVHDIPKRTAVAKLVGYCEGVCGSGVLGETAELRMRTLIAETLAAFNMPSKQERENA